MTQQFQIDLVNRSDRVEHSKSLLFLNKFKDLTYDTRATRAFVNG